MSCAKLNARKECSAACKKYFLSKQENPTFTLYCVLCKCRSTKRTRRVFNSLTSDLALIREYTPSQIQACGIAIRPGPGTWCCSDATTGPASTLSRIHCRKKYVWLLYLLQMAWSANKHQELISLPPSETRSWDFSRRPWRQRKKSVDDPVGMERQRDAGSSVAVDGCRSKDFPRWSRANRI